MAEQAAHIRWVRGSSPFAPIAGTALRSTTAEFRFIEQPDWLGTDAGAACEADKVSSPWRAPEIRGSRVRLAHCDIRIGAERYGDLRQQLYQRGLENGVYLRPLGRTLYTLPPYVISQEALGQIYGTMEALLDYCSGLG